jgi:hypothetical protein
MFKDKSIRKGILASIIASIVFVVILEPLMKLFWKFLNTTSTKVYSSYLDSLYKNAAQGHRNYIDFIILTCIIAALIGILFLSSNRLIRLIKRIKEDDEILNIRDDNERLKLINIKKEKVRNSIEAVKKKYVFIRISSISIITIGTLVFSISLFRMYADIQLNTSFNQRLNVIAPYIEDSQTKELMSKWALMKTKNDYKEIHRFIEKTATENNIDLPKLLLK